jgi:hypothetical protein
MDKTRGLEAGREDSENGLFAPYVIGLTKVNFTQEAKARPLH